MEDTGLIRGITVAAQSSSFQEMNRRQQALADALLKDPAVQSISSFIGVDGSNATLNNGRMLISLKPLEQRGDRVPVVIARLQQLAAQVSGIEAFLQPVQDLTIDDIVSRSPYQFSISATRWKSWKHPNDALLDKLRTLPQFTGVTSSLQNNGLQAFVDIDRDAASRLGISVATIDGALYSAFGQRLISTIFTQSTQYRVVLKLDPQDRQGLDGFNSIYLPSASGQSVPLAQVARIEQRSGPLEIGHLGQFPAAMISFDLAPGVSIGAAVQAIHEAQQQLNLPLSVTVKMQGAAAAFEAALSNQLWLLLAAVATMYIVLGVLYESFVHPVTILSTLPSAGIGALLALMVTGHSLSVIAIIGIILLIGIVQKNAIMMVDFALDAQRQQGLPPAEAILQAAQLRLRPILMTTFAALFGAIPLVIGGGMGAELRQPLGITLVGGLLLSQLLTLFTTPVIYLAFDRLGARWKARFSGAGSQQGTEAVNISAMFIRRPVGTTLLAVAVVLLGAIAFKLLPVSPLPQVDFPTINVNANLPGASPDVMAATVATPLERALGRIAGITEMTSSSALGSTNITIQFDLSKSINDAAREVQAALNSAQPLLPTGMTGNPTYRKLNPADAPIMILSLTSQSLSRSQLYDAASTILAQKISQLPGIGQVNVGGGALPSVRVDLDLDQVNNMGLSLEQVRQAIATGNINAPKGAVEDAQRRWQIQANDQLTLPEQYGDLVVTYRNGIPVRLSQIAHVSVDIQNVRNMGMANGEPSIQLIIFRQPGANIIEAVEAIKAALPELEASMPPAVDVHFMSDRTITIRAALHDSEFTLILSVMLVALVVFVFLRDWRATLIPVIAVPISLVGTFAAMYLLNYSLDNLSLMALIVATGFVVDDAVVVLENIIRHVEDGVAPMQAALRGAREVGFTVLSMSLSLVAVFLPVLLMGGIIGRLFREFAATLSIAIFISLVVSLTLTPMLASRLLKPRGDHNAGAHCGMGRTQLRQVAARLRSQPDLGPQAPPRDAGGFLRHHRLERLFVPDRPQGIFPHTGYRRYDRQYPGGSIDFVSGHVDKTQAHRRHHQDTIRRLRT